MSRISTVQTADLQAKLRRLIDVHGFDSVARRFQLSREPLAKWLAGLPMNTRTIAKIERSVEEATEA